MDPLDPTLPGHQWAVFGRIPLGEVGQCPTGPQLALCKEKLQVGTLILDCGYLVCGGRREER